MIALQLPQMLGDSWPRRADDAGNVLVTERNLQQCSTGIFDTKVVAKIEHRDGDAIVEIKVEQSGAAQKQPVPMLQVALMELSKCRFATIDGDALEAIPLHHSDAAIVVGFAAKIKTVGRKCRKLGNRSRCNQGDGDAVIVAVEAGDSGDARDQHMSFAKVGLGFMKDYFVALEILHPQRTPENLKLWRGEPRKNLEPTKFFEVGLA